MTTHSIVDVDAILEDLRLAVKYAARIGLLRNKEILATLSTAEEALVSNQKLDVSQLTVALNDIAAAIAPVTLADLHFGRDPFLPSNQNKSHSIQLSLTAFCLVILLLIGYFMNSLQREQEALITLQSIQDLRPQQKLTELRKMAQWEAPLAYPQSPQTLYDQYHQKIAELMQINSRVVSSYTTAVLASQIPLFPLGDYFTRSTGMTTQAYPSQQIAPASQPPVPLAASAGGATSSTSVAPGVASSSNMQNAETTGTSSVTHRSDNAFNSNQQHQVDICGEEASGELMLPLETKTYPNWMKIALRDSLNDFCFQLKVISPGGSGAILSQSLNQLEFVNVIKEKVSLRSTWFLPFLYGLLGSAIFMMRNISNVRTPAMEWFPIIMRISLGGVAGIVVGWFAFSKPGVLETTSLLSLPFAMAFLTGYGIDALFSLLDKFNRAMGEGSTKA